MTQPALRIGARLRAARARAGLTHAELGALAGLPAGTVAHYEADRRQPSLAHFAAVADALAAEMGVSTKNLAAELLGL